MTQHHQVSNTTDYLAEREEQRHQVSSYHTYFGSFYFKPPQTHTASAFPGAFSQAKKINNQSESDLHACHGGLETMTTIHQLPLMYYNTN